MMHWSCQTPMFKHTIVTRMAFFRELSRRDGRRKNSTNHEDKQRHGDNHHATEQIVLWLLASR